MKLHCLARWLGAVLFVVCGCSMAQASPLATAEAQAKATFNWRQHTLSAHDQQLVQQHWPTVSFDTDQYTYTFAQIKAKWPTLMRGMQIGYPSPAYLKKRYLKFPGLVKQLHYHDANWKAHSLNVLEVWQAFFRGDYRHAYELGNKYGGYAEVPGILSEIIQAVYLTPTLEMKQALLKDAILHIARNGKAFPYVPGEKAFQKDYAMMRLGYAYAVGRLAEDEKVSAQLVNKHPIIALNTVTELLGVMPKHPMGLALAGGIDANVIRRVGSLVGSLGLDVHAFNAEKAFHEAISEVPNMAIIRYEYANSMLYTKGRAAWPAAKKQLKAAVSSTPITVMEALDVAYAKKHFKALAAWASSGKSYTHYDDKRRGYRLKHDINGYSVLDTMLPTQAVKTASTEVRSGQVDATTNTGSVSTRH